MALLTDPWQLGGVTLPNRVVLAPLAGIGNWFVRLQAKRYGAGLVVSEMVSSFGLKYGDERTHREFLRIHADEHPMAIQLFGHDPEAMRIGASIAAEAGADVIDINMGCPVPKVMKTGAGAALISDPDAAVAVARAAREGSGMPVMVKLRAARSAPRCSSARSQTHSHSATISSRVGSPSRVPRTCSNSHGLPSAPRASMTAAQPVRSNTQRTCSAPCMPPETITGTGSRSTSSAASS